MSKIRIWGREFDLDPIYDCYPGETVMPEQLNAAEAFFREGERILDEALPRVKDYCLARNGREIGEEAIGNIFRYVMPTSVFVKRTGPETRLVALLCEYRFDPEHGLAVVFSDNSFDEIGPQDIIL